MWQSLLFVLLVSNLQSSAFAIAAVVEDAQQERCSPQAIRASLGDLNSLLLCRPSTRVLLLPFLWRPIQIKITCPKRSYQVFTASNEADLEEKVKEGETTWCILDPKTFDPFGPKVCHLQLSPFEKTLVGIKGAKGCIVNSKERFSLIMLASGAIGLVLFYYASFLSSNFVFRMSCGTAFFTLTFVGFLLVVLLRFLPYKKTMATIFAATGTSGLAFVRWATGQWLPSWQQLYNNPWFAAYMLLAITVGAIITYLYDDMNNPKINTVIKVILRLVALSLIYYSTWTSWPVAATCIGLMVAGMIGPEVARGVHETGARVQQAAQATRDYLVTPFTARRRSRLGITGTPQSRTTELRPQRTPAQTQLPLPAQTPNATPTPSMFDEAEVDMSLSPLDYSGLRLIHPKATPPAPWEVLQRRRVKTFEEQMHKALIEQQQPRRTGRSATAGEAGPASSSGRVRAQGSGLTGGMETEEGSQDTGGLSQMVRQGYILNPNSGRLIKIGGDVYNQLLAAGYEPDVAAGALVAPSGGAGTGPHLRQSAGRSRTSARFR